MNTKSGLSFLLVGTLTLFMAACEQKEENTEDMTSADEATEILSDSDMSSSDDATESAPSDDAVTDASSAPSGESEGMAAEDSGAAGAEGASTDVASDNGNQTT
ncbi:hypothetical protein [Candidatus Hepatobacter penaei]|uniref:hypothetical protein n=1 Tax=Candidatus Hepatobacter penaei TaxID=1274402 RepID=UPI0010936826|nr:hypothetical protein [Candidatus Hepatobacter penaei]TGW15601.1 hypothetical protein EIL50_01545 [bacterium NHP-B]